MRQFIIFLFFYSVSVTNAQTPKTEIVNTSATSTLLFINCRNDLKISIPNFKKGDQLKYEIKGGKYIPGKTALNMTIVPDDSLVELKIFKNNLLYDSKRFRAIKLKQPEMILFINDSLYHYSKTYYANSTTTIKIKATANEWTTSMLPNEVNYTVSEFELHLARGKRAVKSLLISKDSINAPYEIAYNGDRYIVEIKKITRINSLGETEITTLKDPVYFTIPLN